MEFTRSRELQERSHALIPGGCHTYAKGDDQYPQLAPGFIERGRGCHVWDVDGNEYIEYGMGLRAVTLGHAFPAVVRAAQEEMLRGSNFTRPSPVEVACAEAVLDVIEGADQIKFTKDGSTANTAAVRLARAYTGRDLVAFCEDHPFFSYDDWFIGHSPMNSGIPQAITDLSVPFRYNDIDSLHAVFERHPDRIACVILEPARADHPRDGFLHAVRDLCQQHGAVFIFDENITGFRWHLGGGQKYYGVVPDLSSFGKAMANGFAVSALAGKREIMELGGLRHDRDRVFLLSTTHGAETHALAACIATMRTYCSEPVIETLHRQGKRLADGVDQAIRDAGLADFVQLHGPPWNLVYATLDPERRPSQEYRTLFLQETIRRGVLMPSLVVSYAHADDDIDRTVDAIRESLVIYGNALEAGTGRFLVGPPSKVVFRKSN